MRLVRYSTCVASVLALLVSTAWGANPVNNPNVMSSQAQSNADATTQAQMAALMQQWTAAVVEFAHQLGAAIPWNQNQTQTPITYAPLYLYAGPGGAAACQFPGGNGTPLGTVAGINLNAPVNLAGLSLNLASAGTQQASAYQQAIGNGNTFFPGPTQPGQPQAGGPFGGTFCAAIAYNQPAAQNMTFATWYAPSASQISAQSSTSGQKTPKMLVYSAGQQFTNSINGSPMGGSIMPIFSMQPGSAQSWMTGVTSKAQSFFNMFGIK